MIKKISAIVLALVLCLSVVVVPASALDLADGSNIAFELKWDKEYYKGGDTAVLSVFMKVAEGYELHSGSIMIALNSAQIKEAADEDKDTVAANWITSDLYASAWKIGTNAAWSFFAESTTIGGKVETASTTEEAELFDTYNKLVVARDTNSDIGGNSKAGVPAEDINALTDAGEPLFQVVYTVAEDVEDGTKLNAAITTGTISSSPAQTAFKYLKNPGSATTTASFAASTIVASAVAEAKVGEETAELTPLAISWWKNQIRFDKNSKDEFAGTFDARMLMSIDNFDEVFGGVAGAEESVFDVGYIFNKGAAIDVDKAKAQVEGGTATYTQVKNAYVSTYFSSEKAYVMSCMIQNIPEADKTLELSAMAYVIYTDANGKTAYAYSPVKTSTFESLYNTNFSNAFPNA